MLVGVLGETVVVEDLADHVETDHGPAAHAAGQLDLSDRALGPETVTFGVDIAAGRVEHDDGGRDGSQSILHME
ncbi:hypothetical protein Apa02nite_036890 [Actinoplanes palleronii]|uniref:Uncharacterized protein n=1 Tax=Actinoplanes palleronii TaxID=113570 RepID=A0ABQ4BAA4_9ACTN|nr:hypothetical protein Apa02nite_036890 [Actinoplanes palleronii]